MKRYIFNFLLCGFLLLNIQFVRAQDSTLSIKPNQTDVGIPIAKTNFDRKVSNYLVSMSKWTVFKTEDYIDMVRVYNTIGGSLPIKNDFYREYYTVFLVMYIRHAAISIDATLSKGMAMYSKKYKIWIGDVPLGNNNSRFKVDTLK